METYVYGFVCQHKFLRPYITTVLKECLTIAFKYYWLCIKWWDIILLVPYFYKVVILNIYIFRTNVFTFSWEMIYMTCAVITYFIAVFKGRCSSFFLFSFPNIPVKGITLVPMILFPSHNTGRWHISNCTNQWHGKYLWLIDMQPC